METNEEKTLNALVDHIRFLSGEDQGTEEFFEAAMLAQAVLNDTVGGSHPLMAEISNSLDKRDWQRAAAASRTLIKLFEIDKLTNPRLVIAHEIEGDLLDIAQSQLELAESTQDIAQKKVYLAIAGFLGGATLEDVLRRLCDAQGIVYDTQHASISKLQSVLFQPAKQSEVISSSENKQITAWGDTRNKADHGKFSDVTYAEVLSMVIGVRAFIDKHLP